MQRVRRPSITIVAIALSMIVALGVASAADRVDDEPSGVREWSLRVAGGVNPSSLIKYYALHGDVGLRLWSSADRWLADRGITGRWIIEPWVAFLDDDHGKHQTQSFEIGVSPLFAKLTFGESVVRPFIEGGEGILYTDIRKQMLGTRVQFTSQFGGGLEYQLRPDVSLTFAARFRHESNAGIHGGNPGINTIYGLVGVTFR